MRVFKCSTKKFEQAASSAHRFSQNEDGGSFTIFVVLGFVLILATAGIGVDIMNFERDRASLQGTLDRAVLAAANVKQELPPKEVVISYIEKSNVRGKLVGEPDVDDNPDIGSRKVTAHAEVDVKTHFMHFFGYPTLKASVTSVAEEAIGSVEISLVLDISGSMRHASATTLKDDAGNLIDLNGNEIPEGGNPVYLTKLAALQDAATKFVAAMYEKENPEKISISIIPYSHQVNAGANLLSNMTGVTTEHTYSHCVDFEEADFNEHYIDPARTLNRSAHFDFDNYGDSYTSESSDPYNCLTRAGSSITPLTNVIDDLNKHIAALTHGGNTSIDTGVKWGAALLDPQFKPVITKLSQQNADPNVQLDEDGYVKGTDKQLPKKVVPPEFSDRPKAYESNVKKVLIVMTDGQNTSSWEINDDYRSGYSDVWYNPNSEHTKRHCKYYWSRRQQRYVEYDCQNTTASGEYSVRISENPPEYFYTRQGTRGHTTPFEEEGTPEGEGNSVRLTYPELWNQVNLDWNARWNYGQWYGISQSSTKWHSNAYSTISSTTKDTRTNNICAALKTKDVDIYGIAFEAPEAGATVIKNCSSGEGFFFKVKDGGSLDDGTEEGDNLSLAQVFQTIAASIKQLRLTQ
ncbi:Tad domain-containing protein [Ruegeria sp. SCP11]|uniref:Tad domain-containing protein n=1 Tax=Ruegeria sp. SCP11 TaxID=3141378 RepID=UPI00333DC7F0